MSNCFIYFTIFGFYLYWLFCSTYAIVGFGTNSFCFYGFNARWRTFYSNYRQNGCIKNSVYFIVVLTATTARPVVHAGFVAVAAHPLFQPCRFCTGFYAFSATSGLNASSVRTGCACWSHCPSGSSCVIWLTQRLKNRFFLFFHPCRSTVGFVPGFTLWATSDFCDTPVKTGCASGIYYAIWLTHFYTN